MFSKNTLPIQLKTPISELFDCLEDQAKELKKQAEKKDKKFEKVLKELIEITNKKKHPDVIKHAIAGGHGAENGVKLCWK